VQDQHGHAGVADGAKPGEGRLRITLGGEAEEVVEAVNDEQVQFAALPRFQGLSAERLPVLRAKPATARAADELHVVAEARVLQSPLPAEEGLRREDERAARLHRQAEEVSTGRQMLEQAGDERGLAALERPVSSAISPGRR
jgi:hypothetical protein